MYNTKQDRCYAFKTFVKEDGGFTSIAVALALLLSLTLAFSVVAAGWVSARSADAQEVADASALAGANVVASYATIAQVCDAIVLSMGLTGMLSLGIGLITAAIPGLSSTGIAAANTGVNILSARQKFSSSATEGLAALEAALPLLIVVNSATVVEASEQGDISYIGCAIPFPLVSQSNLSVNTDVSGSNLEELTEEMGELSDEAESIQEEVDAALYEGWLADCGDTPRNMRERASSLAGLSDIENPNYSSWQNWTFGAALERARSYYAARIAQEEPEDSSLESRVDSAARLRFYTYALEQVNAGYYYELSDGSVEMNLPELPYNTELTRQTTLYTEAVWPCSSNAEGTVLHGVADCPGATGASAGLASLEALEQGLVLECSICQFDVVDMGKVAAASTSIDNGFEHFWRRVVEASKNYEEALDRLVELQQGMKELGESGTSSFEEALEALTAKRFELCPPGAYGCVSIVVRSSEVEVPSSVLSSWISSQQLPQGAAISGAVLAPDEADDQNNILASLLDGLQETGTVAGVAQSVLEMWGNLLLSYGSGSEGVAEISSEAFEAIGGSSNPIASWLADALQGVIEQLGLEPVDMRLRKPVLTNTQNIFSAAGLEATEEIRELIQTLSTLDELFASASFEELAAAFDIPIDVSVEDGALTIGELTIPGTDIEIPLTVDLSQLLDAA